MNDNDILDLEKLKKVVLDSISKLKNDVYSLDKFKESRRNLNFEKKDFDTFENKSENEKKLYIASLIDHTLLDPLATTKDFEILYKEASDYKVCSVCIPPNRLEDMSSFSLFNCKSAYKDLRVNVDSMNIFFDYKEFAKYLRLPGVISKDYNDSDKWHPFKSDVRICTVIGFPLGYSSINSKVYEVECINSINGVIKNGFDFLASIPSKDDGVESMHYTNLEIVDEIDMVISLSHAKEKDINYIYQEVSSVREVTKGKVLKVILETAALSDEEKTLAGFASIFAGADFLKTSTGFSKHGGASVEDVKLLRKICDLSGAKIGVKASGGIKTKDDVIKYLYAGADRIGTSSTKEILS